MNMNTRNPKSKQNHTRNKQHYLNGSRNTPDGYEHERRSGRWESSRCSAENRSRGSSSRNFYAHQDIAVREPFNRRSYDRGSEQGSDDGRSPVKYQQHYHRSPQWLHRNHNFSRSPSRDLERMSSGAGSNRRRSRGAGESPQVSSRKSLPLVRCNESMGNTWNPRDNRSIDERESSEDRGSRRKRGREEIDFPALDELGGLNDPNKRNLSASRSSPIEELVTELNQPALDSLSSTWPRIVRRRASWDDCKPLAQENEDADVLGPSPDVDAPQKLLLVPLDYPNIKLSHQQKLDLEEAITIEVASSKLDEPLRFSSISFRKGFLDVECFNSFSADWLQRTIPNISSYVGPPVEAKTKLEPQEEQYIIHTFLPRSSDKSNEFLMQLLKSQNVHDIDAWTLVSRKDRGHGVAISFSIDRKSAYDIIENGQMLFYRMGTVPVRGLNLLTMDQENGQRDDYEELQVDEDGDLNVEKSSSYVGHIESSPQSNYSMQHPEF